MNTRFWSVPTMSSVGAVDLVLYLRAKGWRKADQDSLSSTWLLDTPKGEAEVLVPEERRAVDYINRVAEALRTLEEVEGRDAQVIMVDLKSVSSDVIRVRPDSGRILNGSIRYEEGLRLIQRAGDMMMAAACAAARPQAVYASRKPSDADSYFEHLELGHTEHGSYIITIISRVPPALESAEDQLPSHPTEDPFARRVTLTLARGLAAARAASRKAAASGNFDDFMQAVPMGVSANLCEAVSNIGGSDGLLTLDVAFGWSPVRPLTIEAPRAVSFTGDSLKLLQEAARVFRERVPLEEFELRGIVVGLRRDPAATTGRVIIYGVVENRSRPVTCELVDEVYSIATVAHERRSEVTVRGDLVKEGRSYSLRRPHDFRIEERVYEEPTFDWPSDTEM